MPYFPQDILNIIFRYINNYWKDQHKIILKNLHQEYFKKIFWIEHLGYIQAEVIGDLGRRICLNHRRVKDYDEYSRIKHIYCRDINSTLVSYNVATLPKNYYNILEC